MNTERSPGGVIRDESVPDTRDWITLLMRRWSVIVVCIVAVTLLFVVLAVTVVGNDFEARATIVVTSPEFSSSLRPVPIGVEGYRTLLESNTVVADTASKLAAQEQFGTEDLTSLKERMSSSIFTSVRGQPQVLSPLIELRARAETAEAARILANAWIESFLAASERMMEEQLSPVIALIQAQYMEKRDELGKLEDERDAVAVDFLEQINAEEGRWDARLADVQAAGERELAEFAAETERLVAAYQTESRELVRSIDQLSEVSAISMDVREELGTIWRQLVALRIQLAQTPQFLALARAITDEALWQARVSESIGGDFPQGIVDQRLVSQELNPAHTELSLQVAELEVALEAVELSEQDRARARHAAQQLDTVQHERSAGLSTLLAMRAADARRLRSQKAIELRNATRDRRAALDVLTSGRDRALEASSRDIQYANNRLEQLAGPYEETELAGYESRNSGVALASPVSLSRGAPPSLALTLVAGLFIGLVLGLVAAVVSDSR